jgi:hypothetical protein
MKVLVSAVRECVSLFVDDGSLAATVIAWIVLSGLLLFIGLALILIENALRSA